MNKPFSSRYAVVLLFFCIGLAGCNLPNQGQDTSGTLSVTEAYQTVEARLTQATTRTPLVSRTPSPTDSGLVTASPSAPSATRAATKVAPTALSSTAPAAGQCDQAAAGNPIDVTIPDDTQMTPGQSFTKTWRLQNVGTCPWTRSYKVQLFSGEAMGAPASVPLTQDVAPGKSIDISVDMIAPKTAGTYQGNWKLRNASDAWFGIGPNGNSAFWVRIAVVGQATTTVTATATTTSPTLTPTPAIQVSGPVTLNPNDKLDLDTKQTNTGNNEDLSYESNADGKHLLIPHGTVVIGSVGNNQPSFNDCKTASLGVTPLIVDDLPVGTYLCYRTKMGLPGRALILNLSPETGALNLDMVTWSVP